MRSSVVNKRYRQWDTVCDLFFTTNPIPQANERANDWASVCVASASSASCVCSLIAVASQSETRTVAFLLWNYLFIPDNFYYRSEERPAKVNKPFVQSRVLSVVTTGKQSTALKWPAVVQALSTSWLTLLPSGVTIWWTNPSPLQSPHGNSSTHTALSKNMRN